MVHSGASQIYECMYNSGHFPCYGVDESSMKISKLWISAVLSVVRPLRMMIRTGVHAYVQLRTWWQPGLDVYWKHYLLLKPQLLYVTVSANQRTETHKLLSYTLIHFFESSDWPRQIHTPYLRFNYTSIILNGFRVQRCILSQTLVKSKT